MTISIKHLVLIFTCACISGTGGSREKRAATGANVPLTQAQKLEIVTTHNNLRRARGSSNMRYMTWDSELAWIAEQYGQKCQSGHNGNRNSHTTLTSVGENIWSSTGKASSFEPAGAINSWHNEINYFDYAAKTCQTGKACGHYTQVVWAKSYKVGCSLSTCEDTSLTTWRNSIKFVCNYASAGNVYFYGKMMSIYETGTACSKCAEGDYCRKSLCANSSRDFIDGPYIPDVPVDTTGLIVAIVLLTLIIVAMIAFMAYKKREVISTKVVAWKGQLQAIVPGSA